MENKTIEVNFAKGNTSIDTIPINTQVKTTRVVYAGRTPHAVTVHNLTKLDVGTTGTVYESYHKHSINTTVYVVKFYVGETDEFAPTLVFAFMSATSFVLDSQ